MILFCASHFLQLSLKLKIQDFRAALRDDEVKSLFVEIFNDKIEQCVQTAFTILMNDLTDKFTKRIDELNINMHQLRSELQRKETSIGQLVSDNQLLKASIQSLSIKLEEVENYQQCDNLIFSSLKVRMADRLAGTNYSLAILSDSLTQKGF